MRRSFSNAAPRTWVEDRSVTGKDQSKILSMLSRKVSLGLRISWLKTETWLNPLREVLVLFIAWLSWTVIPMLAMSASLLCILGPMKLLAIAHLAEVTSKGPNFKEAQEREKFTNSILNGRTREAPLVHSLEGKTGASHARGALLDIGQQ
jgi:hypothetical protein